ncbi:MAG: ribose-phosphate pyrophosphokinase [Defluviitaleaceae bacterium]|nr:ribose-phosphate pyrophosphokinase [Defluviitaleaceae bacterium]
MSYRTTCNGTELNFAGDVGIIALKSSKELGAKINESIKKQRKEAGLPVSDTYLIDFDEVRFSNGEGKILLNESVRGKDVFIICDIGNYSCTYTLYGHDNRMSPDDHYQDIKRAISAMGGKADRVNVMMPMLYASRQDRRKGRESLDCAMTLRELEHMGVKTVLTFDVHNSSVQNAVSLMAFENIYATYEIVRRFMKDEPAIITNKEDFLIISPDVGGMERAVYYSTVMKADVGMFYKRRDFSRVESGRNPIVQHEYLGRDVAGKNVIIIDDMIATGESICEIVRELKGRNAKKVFVATTFAMFTKGDSMFQALYDEGSLTRLYSTNLTYIPETIIEKPWLTHVDMSPFAAEIINTLNMNSSIEPVMNATARIKEMFPS